MWILEGANFKASRNFETGDFLGFPSVTTSVEPLIPFGSQSLLYSRLLSRVASHPGAMKISKPLPQNEG